VDFEPTKVLALSPDPTLTPKLAQDLQQRYPKDDVYLTQSSPIYLEATHPSVNKGFAVQYLAEKILNISAAEVMAIGDNFNDLTMLEYAGISIAMGDAPQPVQDQANWVTKNVEQDGVVLALEKFLPSGQSILKSGIG
jgi:hydroxymethylpyrimidine pyrophosphatase-like HAD family hydrolase